MHKPLHIWITGASRGIGKAIAEMGLTQENVIISATSRAECDVTHPASVAAAHAHMVAQHGPIDVLVNNAGVGIFADLSMLSTTSFDETISVNLRGPFLCIKNVLPSMIERKRGMILTINSVSAVTTFTGCSAYGASKAGLLALTRSLREEVRQHGIRVTDLLVGATSTEIWDNAARTEHADRMMLSSDIARHVWTIVRTFDDPRSMIEEVIIRPQHGDL
ncbi:SDR family oxidoreductase [soil metagenome]